MSVLYTGHRDDDGAALVLKNGREFSPRASQKLWNHSPTGFEWSYGGSGPAQLALALLLDVTKDGNVATDYHQQFKWEVVAKFSKEGWSLWEFGILNWLAQAQQDDMVDLREVPQ